MSIFGHQTLLYAVRHNSNNSGCSLSVSYPDWKLPLKCIVAVRVTWDIKHQTTHHTTEQQPFFSRSFNILVADPVWARFTMDRSSRASPYTLHPPIPLTRPASVCVEQKEISCTWMTRQTPLSCRPHRDRDLRTNSLLIDLHLIWPLKLVEGSQRTRGCVWGEGWWWGVAWPLRGRPCLTLVLNQLCWKGELD